MNAIQSVPQKEAWHGHVEKAVRTTQKVILLASQLFGLYCLAQNKTSSRLYVGSQLFSNGFDLAAGAACEVLRLSENETHVPETGQLASLAFNQGMLIRQWRSLDNELDPSLEAMLKDALPID